jgi:hypothetical protein
MKKRKGTGPPPEFWREHERVQKLIADRIAHHDAKIAEERARREREAS